jgi:hypothetical protein
MENDSYSSTHLALKLKEKLERGQLIILKTKKIDIHPI